jgi:hypothetical protein
MEVSEPFDRTPLSAAELRRLVGDRDDATLMRIVATGAGADEVLEAVQWLRADDDLGTELGHARGGVVGQVYEILLEEEAIADEP